MKSQAFLIAVALFLALAGTAAAQDAAPAAASAETAPASPETAPAATVEGDPLGALGDLVAAVKAGQWRMAVALLLALLMLGLGRVRDKIPLFAGDRGGAILVMLLALAGAVSTALASSATLDWKLFAGAVGVAFTAVGGVSWIKRLIWPKP